MSYYGRQHHQQHQHQQGAGSGSACHTPSGSVAGGPRPLPRGTTAYGRGKRLEAEGDLRGAYECFLEALMRGDRTDSALKDISNIYVMFGRIEEAIAFLKANSAFVTNRRGYENLILRLQQELDLEQKSLGLLNAPLLTTTFDTTSPTGGSKSKTATNVSSSPTLMPRTLLLTGIAGGSGSGSGDLSTNFLARVFPNAPKIRRVLVMDERRALVQFATYSSARKALNVLSAASASATAAASTAGGVDSDPYFSGQEQRGGLPLPLPLPLALQLQQQQQVQVQLAAEWAAKEDEQLMETLEKAEEAKEGSCMESRRLRTLPYNLQVFNDERSLVSYYSIHDRVVLQIVEKLLFSEAVVATTGGCELLH